MIFTLIFKEFQVSLEGEDFKKLVSADYINEGTLNRMKFVKKDDKWIRADLSTVQDSDIPRTAPPPPSPPTAEPSPSIPEPPLPQSPIPPPQPAFDQDILVERIVDKVVEKVSEKFMSVISELRHQILISSEEQKISSEGQSDMISQQISSLSQRMEILEKDQQKVLAQMESLATENARIEQRLEENITVQCTTAQILIKTVQQILDRTPSSGPSSSSAPSSRPFSSPAPHLFSTGPPPPKGPKIEFLSDEESD